MFGQVGDGQGEGGRHAKTLRHAQQRENGEVMRHRQKGCGNRKDGQADPYAVAAVDVASEQRDHDARDRHAKRAGIDREAHRRAPDAEFPDQRRQNGLRRKQVDKRQECDERDQAETQAIGGRREGRL